MSAPPQSSSDVRQHYSFLRQIAEGGTSQVYEAVHKRTGEKRAIKKVHRLALEDESLLWREVSIMRNLSHPNVVRFYEMFEDASSFYLVLELVEGKEIFDQLVELGRYSEREAAQIVRQVVDALAYLHANKIAHRDLKPENLLSFTRNGNLIVKITDFGLSKCFAGDKLETAVGSDGYLAPELIESDKYDEQVDMFSLGVLTYVLLAGYLPWLTPVTDSVELMREIMRCEYAFEPAEWDNLSADARDFVSKLILHDPKQRMTAVQCQQHVWIRGCPSLVPPPSPSPATTTNASTSSSSPRTPSALSSPAVAAAVLEPSRLLERRSRGSVRGSGK